MAEALLHFLGVQTAVLCVAVPVALLLRAGLLRLGCPGAAYVAWLGLPLALLAAALPRPALAPIQVDWPAGVLAAVPSQAAASWWPEVARSPWVPLLVAVWMAGAVVCAAMLVRQQRRYLQSLTRTPQGWRSPHGSSPALLGVLRPHVVLPADFEARYDAQEQALVLAHEHTHQRRYDNAWNLLATALLLMHWFNPLAWLAGHRMRADQELSCDDAVVRRQPASVHAYVRALAKAQPGTSALWASPWASVHPLIERIRMLTIHRSSPTRRRAGMALAAAVALAGAGLAYAGLEAAPASDASKTRYADIRLKLRIDGKDVASPRMVAQLGSKASLAFDPKRPDGAGPAGPRWEMDFTTTREADGRLKIVSQIRAGTPAREVGTHTHIASEGEAITLNKTVPGPNGHLEVERVVRLLDKLPGK